jgi:hypothetical protein
MKKIYTVMLAAVLMLASGCNTGLLGGLGGDTTGNGTGTGGGLGDILGGVLGGVLGGLGSQNTVDGLLGLVIGSVQVSESELYGAWYYTQPGCAFTSENLLAKAGGAVAAETCKDKLLPVYNTLGISSQNTQFQFTQDHQFQAYVKGIPVSGTYTYDPQNATVKLKTMLFSCNMYVTRTTQGLAFTFESKNLLKVLQAVAAVSGNSTLQTVGDLSKQFDGVRLGFDMAPIRG